MTTIDGPDGAKIDVNGTSTIRPHEKRNSMTLTAQVENNPQPLNLLRPFGACCASIPSLLRPEAQITLQAVFACFEKQAEVKEGLIGDLIWGFQQCGIDQELTLVGLIELEKAGYIKFQAADNNYVDFSSDQITGAWVRYQRKLLDMVYDGGHSG